MTMNTKVLNFYIKKQKFKIFTLKTLIKLRFHVPGNLKSSLQSEKRAQDKGEFLC